MMGGLHGMPDRSYSTLAAKNSLSQRIALSAVACLVTAMIAVALWKGLDQDSFIFVTLVAFPAGFACFLPLRYAAKEWHRSWIWQVLPGLGIFTAIVILGINTQSADSVQRGGAPYALIGLTWATALICALIAQPVIPPKPATPIIPVPRPELKLPMPPNLWSYEEWTNWWRALCAWNCYRQTLNEVVTELIPPPIFYLDQSGQPINTYEAWNQWYAMYYQWYQQNMAPGVLQEEAQASSLPADAAFPADWQPQTTTYCKICRRPSSESTTLASCPRCKNTVCVECFFLSKSTCPSCAWPN